MDGAKLVGERIRMSIEVDGFACQGEEIPLAASGGIWVGEVSHMEPGNEDFMAQYLDRADQTLYHAKSQGKNRVEVYGENSVGS